MNAYELANKMEQLAGHFHNEAINMLRQQADRIAELERLVSDMIYEKSSGVYQGKYLEQYWVKQQSAEPVAWIKKDTLIFLGNYEFGSITIQVQKQKDDEFDIPLYTTPQIKELSDEEILSLSAFKSSPYDAFIEYEKEDLIKFARAILKKASEK